MGTKHSQPKPRPQREHDGVLQPWSGTDLSAMVRYRDPQTGRTWNGFGRPPNWIRGQNRGRFRVG